MRRCREFPDLVALFVNTVVFECRSAPSSAFRSLRRTAGGTPQSRALRRSRYDPLDTSPYLRTEPLEIFQYVFSQNKGDRQACLSPIACVASTAPHDDHSCNIRDKDVVQVDADEVQVGLAGPYRPGMRGIREIPRKIRTDTSSCRQKGELSDHSRHWPCQWLATLPYCPCADSREVPNRKPYQNSISH